MTSIVGILKDDGTRVFICKDEKGEILSSLTAEPYDGNFIVHNQVYKWGKGYAAEYRRHFANIRATLRPFGRLLITNYISRPGVVKVQKYWRLMGFEYFDFVEVNGQQVLIAVMEV